MTLMIGVLLGWLCGMAVIHGLRISQLQKQLNSITKAAAMHALCTARQTYLQLVANSGRCPDCQVKANGHEVIHTEDCRARKLFEDADKFFGRDGEKP